VGKQVEQARVGGGVHDQVAPAQALQRTRGVGVALLPREVQVADLDLHARGEELEPALRGVDLVLAHVTPVEVVAHEVLREEHIRLDEDELAHTRAGQRGGKLAPHGAQTHDPDGFVRRPRQVRR